MPQRPDTVFCFGCLTRGIWFTLFLGLFLPAIPAFALYEEDIIYRSHAYNIETSTIGGTPFERLYRRKGSGNSQLHNRQ